MTKPPISVSVDLRVYDLETVRISAHLLTDEFHVLLVPAGRSAAKVLLTPKRPGSAAGRGERRLRAVLDQELLRTRVAENNQKLREHVIGLAMGRTPPAETPRDPALSADQQAELDRLIAEVEEELHKEAKSAPGKDPLGILKTWEEQHGRKRTA
ncbi:MAG: hypothetical protein WC969_13325 [Elusimicrobiota bacterium]|jgi:hypothetical protein